MYFDLEFARGWNPGLDGEELVQAWINVVAGEANLRFVRIPMRVVCFVCVRER